MHTDEAEATKTHILYMKECIVLGKKAMENGDFPVGSVVVKDNKIIGRGSEAVKSSNDVTKHAEIEAIRDALNNTGAGNLEDCDLYTTHEPCFMCSYVIRHYKLRAVIYGVKVEHVGGITSDLKVMLTSKIPNWGKVPIIIDNVMEEECNKLSKKYKINN